MKASTCMERGERMDDTSQNIIDATMELVRDRGYVATTTKDIAQMAGVNECTLFRKFKNKKDIVLSGISQEKWQANVTSEIFQKVSWELKVDLEMFMNVYLDKITTDFVNLSIGLRAPQIYQETAPMIMNIPKTFLDSLLDYLQKMEQLGKIPNRDYNSIAMTIFSATFGFVFLKASFGQALTTVERESFIRDSVNLFISGIL